MEEEHAVSEEQKRDEAARTAEASGEQPEAVSAQAADAARDSAVADGVDDDGAQEGASGDVGASDSAAQDGVSDDEVIELEVDEDDIEYYIVDEDDNEIGFAVLDDDGNPQEYYYDEGEEPIHGSGASEKDGAQPKRDPGVLFTREEVAQTTSDLNAVYHEGKETIDELKETYEDIMSGFGFLKKH